MRTSPLQRIDAEERILRVIHEQPEQSLDLIAIKSNYARCTVHRIIVRLRAESRLMVTRGRRSNRYEVIPICRQLNLL